MIRALSFFFFLMAMLVVSNASADTAQIDVSADPVIEVGGVGTLKMQVSGGQTPQDPQLAGANNNVAIGGTNVFNLAVQGQQLLVASWTIRGRAVGTVTLTPSVQYGGKRISAKAVTIKIVPSGAGPKKNPGGFTFSFPFPGMGDDDDDEPVRPPPTANADPKLSLENAPAPTAFLRATTDKKSVVVGEQVILEVDLYLEAGLPEPDFNDPHEASSPQFVRRSLMIDDTKPEKLGQATAGGKLWDVKRIRRAALFPLEAGDLPIGAMSMNMISIRGRGVRMSDPISIHVEEPPKQGRASNYALGDVGSYTLTAEVTPREVKRGEVVSVRMEISGRGNVPAAIPLPTRAGIEWLDSEVHEKVGRLDADHWGGTRSLTYVVKLKKEGDVDLGDIALPVWNVEKNAYDDLRAPLGKVHVLPGTLPDDEKSAELPELPPAKSTLSGMASSKHLDDSPLFWLGLLAPAAVFASAAGARTAARRARDRFAARAASPARELQKRMREAEEAASDAATVRVLEQATIAKRSVNVRGVLKDEAARSLEEAGVKPDVAKEIVAILRECEEARFSPDEAKTKEMRERWERAKKALEAL